MSASEGLVFPFEADDSFRARDAYRSYNTKRAEFEQAIGGYLEPSSIFHVRLLRAVRQAAASPGRPDLELLALQLAGQGYRVSIRQGQGGGVGTQCFKNLRHSFLVAHAPDHDGNESFIIELMFREHFAIPHRSARYQAVLPLIPQVVVMQPTNLEPLVETICRELQRAFASAGQDLPPWRQARSVLSKWMPKQATENPICLPSLPRLRCATPGESPFTMLMAPEAASSHVTHEKSEQIDRLEGISEPASPTSPLMSTRPSGGSPITVLHEPLPAFYEKGMQRQRSLLSWSLAQRQVSNKENDSPRYQAPELNLHERPIRVVKLRGPIMAL